MVPRLSPSLGLGEDELGSDAVNAAIANVRSNAWPVHACNNPRIIPEIRRAGFIWGARNNCKLV